HRVRPAPAGHDRRSRGGRQSAGGEDLRRRSRDPDRPRGAGPARDGRSDGSRGSGGAAAGRPRDHLADRFGGRRTRRAHRRTSGRAARHRLARRDGDPAATGRPQRARPGPLPRLRALRSRAPGAPDLEERRRPAGAARDPGPAGDEHGRRRAHPREPAPGGPGDRAAGRARPGQRRRRDPGQAARPQAAGELFGRGGGAVRNPTPGLPRADVGLWLCRRPGAARSADRVSRRDSGADPPHRGAALVRRLLPPAAARRLGARRLLLHGVDPAGGARGQERHRDARLRSPPALRGAAVHRRGRSRGTGAAAADPDDHPLHPVRPAAARPRVGRRGRTPEAARPRRHRRPRTLDAGDPLRRALGLCGPPSGEGDFPFERNIVNVKKTLIPAFLAGSLLMAGSLFAKPAVRHDKQAKAPGYHVVREIHLAGDGGWDYLTVDSAARRLYVSHSTRVNVVDVDSGKPVGEVQNLSGVHGIAIAQDLGRGFISNGKSSTVTIFDLKSLATLSEVKTTGENPDAILYDPFSSRVFAFNGRTGNATVLDAKTGKVEGTIELGGKPEFATSDLLGRIFVNLEDKSEVVELGAKDLKVQARWPLKPCEEPSGMA